MSGCTSRKRRYRTKLDAQLALFQIRIDDEQRQHREKRWYKCHLCRGFHLTSQDKEGDHDGRGEAGPTVA